MDRERLRAYPRIVLTLFITIALAWVVLSNGLLDPKGKPLGYDFITFWAASKAGLAGHPQDAYNIPLLFEIEKTAVPAMQNMFAWYYPPTFYLLILPIAWLPYLAAYFTFVLTTLAAYVQVLRRVIRGREAMWCLAAFPGLWTNLFHGQNGFLTAALAAAALLSLPHRATLAGVFIGLLAIKPHLAVLFPVALIAIGAWRTFIVAGLVAVAFMVAGTLALGMDTLYAFIDSLSFAQLALEMGALPWTKMPTVFALLRMLGAPVMMAYVVHALVACLAIGSVWLVWRRSDSWPLRGAALMSATFLVSPYLFDYDMVWLAFPIAWLALEGIENGWLRAEREILVAAWLLPLFMMPIAKLTSVQVGPLVLAAVMWVVLRRTGRILPRHLGVSR